MGSRSRRRRPASPPTKKNPPTKKKSVTNVGAWVRFVTPRKLPANAKVYVEQRLSSNGKHTRVQINVYDSTNAHMPREKDPAAPLIGTLAERTRELST